MSSTNLTAVQWLREQFEQGEKPAEEIYAAALLLERHQHGNTWDAAIRAHEDRGGVIARSITDFDQYRIK